jgi:hypothetical protein
MDSNVSDHIYIQVLDAMGKSPERFPIEKKELNDDNFIDIWLKYILPPFNKDKQKESIIQIFDRIIEDTVRNEDGTYSNVGDDGKKDSGKMTKKKAD